MKTRVLFAIILAVAVGCGHELAELPIENNLNDSVPGSGILYATMESPSDPETRTYVGEDMKMLWDESDAISVFKFNTANQEYVYSGEAGESGAEFVPSQTGAPTGSSIRNVYAVYPYSSELAVSASGTIDNQEGGIVNYYGCRLFSGHTDINMWGDTKINDATGYGVATLHKNWSSAVAHIGNAVYDLSATDGSTHNSTGVEQQYGKYVWIWPFNNTTVQNALKSASEDNPVIIIMTDANGREYTFVYSEPQTTTATSYYRYNPEAGEITNVYIPHTQHYRANSFGNGANVTVSSEETSKLYFKNLCGYLRLRLYGDDITVSGISLEAINGEAISGYATVAAAPGTDPVLSFDTSSSESEIILDCSEGVKLGTSKETATDFWFVIPPVTMSGGFKITVNEYGSTATFEKSASYSFTIERNLLKNMAPLKVTKPEITATSISFSESTYRVKRGESIKLTPTILPAEASNLPITWSSSNTSWATVDADGNVTGMMKNQTVTITASIGNVSGTCKVKVDAPDLVSFTLSPNPITLFPLDQVTVTATPIPSDAEIINGYWEIDADRIATPIPNNESCTVCANNKGTAVLRVVLNYNIEKTATVNVLDPVPEAVDLGLSVKWGNKNCFAETVSAEGRHYSFTEATHYNSTDSDVAEYFTDGKWRMPTKDDFQELLDNCTSAYATVNGVSGLRFTSRINGESIFLPNVGGYAFNGVVYKYYDSSQIPSYYWASTERTRFYWSLSNYQPNVVTEAENLNEYKHVVRPVQ